MACVVRENGDCVFFLEMRVCCLQNEWVVCLVSVERESRLCFLEMCVCCLQE